MTRVNTDTYVDADDTDNSVNVHCFIFIYIQQDILYNIKAVQQHDFGCTNNNIIYKHGSNIVNDHDCDCFNNLKSLH